MKIHTFWTREGCDEGDAPWVFAAVDELGVEANSGYSDSLKAEIAKHADARLLIIQIPSAALRLWDPPAPTVQGVVVAKPGLEQLADELGIKALTSEDLKQHVVALRQRFAHEHALFTDAGINGFVSEASCTDELAQEWIETLTLLGTPPAGLRFYCRRCQQELHSARERDDHEALPH